MLFKMPLLFLPPQTPPFQLSTHRHPNDILRMVLSIVFLCFYPYKLVTLNQTFVPTFQTLSQQWLCRKGHHLWLCLVTLSPRDPKSPQQFFAPGYSKCLSKLPLPSKGGAVCMMQQSEFTSNSPHSQVGKLPQQVFDMSSITHNL